MQEIENIKSKGELNIVLTGPDGKVRESHQFKNLVVTTGLAFIISRMAAATANPMSHMEVGTGGTAAAAADTALGAAIASSRTALTSSTVSGNTITYSASFGTGVGTGAITEAGIFNASSAGTMLCRTVFPVVNKQSTDTMTITWQVSVS